MKLHQSSSGFVGRRQEFDFLKQRLDVAREGSGSVVLVAGEAGIGKTRLLEKLAAHAEESDAAVAWGHCSEDPGAPAMRPWAKIAGALLQARTREQEWTTAYPQKPFQVFDALLALVSEVARERPVLLVLEDLHLADPATLLLLRLLTKELERLAVLLAVTTRYVNQRPGEPLPAAVASLLREPSFVRASLEGLTDADVLQLLNKTKIAEAVDFEQAFAARLRRETDGNPFLIREIVDELIRTGKLSYENEGWRCALSADDSLGLPANVLDVFRERLATLSANCQKVLAAAAVLGFTFSLCTLRKLEHLAALPILESLDEAEREQLIREAAGLDGRYLHRTVLSREAIYATLPKSVRIRLHHQAAEALVDLYGEDTTRLPEIAGHFLQAAALDPDGAVRYAGLAGDRAMEALNFEQAVHWYGAALRVQDATPPRSSAETGELLLRLSSALSRSGDSAADDERHKNVDAMPAARNGSRDAGQTNGLSHAARRNRFGLTPREMEVMALLAEGYSSHEIASRLVVSVRTAEHHLYHIYNKTGARGRAGAAALAAREGMDLATEVADRAALVRRDEEPVCR